MLGDSAHDGAVFQSVGDDEAQELVGFGHALAFEHCADTDVEFLEILEGNVGFHGVGVIIGFGILPLGFLQFFHLEVDDFVVNLFEEQLGLPDVVPGGDEVGGAETVPFEFAYVEHAAQALAAERQEGLEGDGQVGHELHRKVEYRLDTFGVRLDEFPRLAVGQVLVADAGEVHGFLLCVAETEVFEQALHLCLHVGEFADGVAVVIGQLAGGGHLAVVVFLCQHEGAVDEVAVDGNELIVVAGLEVAPCEVVVLCLGGVGREHIAQDVLLAGQFFKILVEPDGPVARCRDFLVLQVQKLVGRDVVGQDVAALGAEHGREDDAVEHDVVLSDKVNQAG